jgi:hypothetical protein
VTHQQERSDGQTKHRITETKWLKTGDGAARVTASIYGTNQTDQKKDKFLHAWPPLLLA